MQDQDLRTAEQRGVEFEGGILGCRADQRYGAVLDKGQKPILLRAVETVNLVYKQNGLLPVHA